MYISIAFIIIGIIILGLFAYLYGWWMGYKHGVSVNIALLQQELEILGINQVSIER